MPRRGRLHIPGGCYHVIGRGLERRYIFQKTADKQDFLSRLDRCLSRSQSQCLAWAIMSNHYHLLIRAGPQPLSKLMASLLGGYGGSYNRRHARAGYVFQNRFKSILCDEDSYLLELVRYIHLNPVKAKIVNTLRELDRYPWTGHSGMVKKKQYSWHEVDAVLCLFGETRRKAKLAYRRFMLEGLNTSEPSDLSGGGLVRSIGGWESVSLLRSEHARCIGDERILGGGQFVDQVLACDNLQIEAQTLRIRQGWTLEKLIDLVCNYCDIEQQYLITKARENNLALAKSLICYWGVEELGLTSNELCPRLQISQQAVSKWVKKGCVHLRSESLTFDDLIL